MTEGSWAARGSEDALRSGFAGNPPRQSVAGFLGRQLGIPGSGRNFVWDNSSGFGPGEAAGDRRGSPFACEPQRYGQSVLANMGLTWRSYISSGWKRVNNPRHLRLERRCPPGPLSAAVLRLRTRSWNVVQTGSPKHGPILTTPATTFRLSFMNGPASQSETTSSRWSGRRPTSR